MPTFLLSHFELSVLHLGSTFEQWLIATPDIALWLRAAYVTQNSTLQFTKLLQISHMPAFLLSHFGKFEQWLIDTPNTTLRLRAAYTTQNSMPQPSELPCIS
jgi:hypothetical protein